MRIFRCEFGPFKAKIRVRFPLAVPHFPRILHHSCAIQVGRCEGPTFRKYKSATERYCGITKSNSSLNSCEGPRRSFRSVTKTVHAPLPCRPMRCLPTDRNMTRRMTDYSAQVPFGCYSLSVQFNRNRMVVIIERRDSVGVLGG